MFKNTFKIIKKANYIKVYYLIISEFSILNIIYCFVLFINFTKSGDTLPSAILLDVSGWIFQNSTGFWTIKLKKRSSRVDCWNGHHPKVSINKIMPKEYKSHKTPLYGTLENISGLQYCFEPALKLMKLHLKV